MFTIRAKKKLEVSSSLLNTFDLHCGNSSNGYCALCLSPCTMDLMRNKRKTLPRRNFLACSQTSKLLVIVWDEIRIEMKKYLETFIIWQSNFLSIESDNKKIWSYILYGLFSFVFSVIHYTLQKNGNAWQI